MQSTQEVWRPVPAFDGHYEVSNRGRIRSTLTGRLLKQSPAGAGYLRATHTHADGRQSSAYAHRLVALAFLGEPPFPGAQVRHMDGNNKNNALSNLKWGTPKQNHNDKYRHGTAAAQRSSCRYGHKYPEAEIERRQDGSRICPTCAANTSARAIAPIVDGKRLCPPGHSHGKTLTCRSRHLCSCQECLDAMNAYRRKKGEKRKVAPLVNGVRRCPPDHMHGATITCGNSHLCKCDGCREAKRTYRLGKK